MVADICFAESAIKAYPVGLCEKAILYAIQWKCITIMTKDIHLTYTSTERLIYTDDPPWNDPK